MVQRRANSNSRPAAKKSKSRPKQPAKPDRLMSQLEGSEKALQHWIRQSPDNRNFFRSDPIGAMREAGLNIDDDILLELEMITSAIARKLR